MPYKGKDSVLLIFNALSQDVRGEVAPSVNVRKQGMKVPRLTN